MANRIRIYDPKKDIYGKPLYGSPRPALVVDQINVSYSIKRTSVVKLVGHYQVNARYKQSTPTIEDIYSYTTDRFMKMGCLDGPAFPFYDRSDT